MRIAVFGLGYVGSVTAACLADEGHMVIGVDPNVEKVSDFRQKRAPVKEPGLDDLIASGVSSGRLTATRDPVEAVDGSDVALICVGTPSQPDGSINLDHVRSVVAEIGHALRHRSSKYTVVVRSTVLPGTMRGVVIPGLERASGKRADEEIDVCFNPEFLREGTSIFDYHEPPKIVVGTDTGKPNQVVYDLYQKLNCPRFETVYEIAELAKYVDNTWHALKVGFANEIGRVAKDLQIDGRDVMEIMTGDTKLNISSKYLRPGFAYGGSCLPKDVSALESHTRTRGLDLPLLDAISHSNELQIEHAIRLIRALGSRRIGLLGLTFKADTDDLRNSPLLELTHQLTHEGLEVKVLEPNLELGNLIGSNRIFAERNLPGLEEMLVSSPEEIIDFADLLILGKIEDPLVECAHMVKPGQRILDLVGMNGRPLQGEYFGIAW